jgi:hypothetical protein
LVENVTEDAYRAFAVRLSDVITAGGHPREVFALFLEVTGSDLKEQLARQIYIAMERLGADPELLSVVESGRTGSTPFSRITP